MSEQEFKNALAIALCRDLPVRVWVQNSGKALLARGGAIKLAPPGAGDLSGCVADGSGIRLESETKAPRTANRESQARFAANCLAWGVVYLRIRAKATRSLEENVADAVAIVRQALELRGVDTSARARVAAL